MYATPDLLAVTGADRCAGPLPAPVAALAALGAPLSFRWLGHAGIELDWAGRRLVIDPIISDKIGGLISRALPVPPFPGRADLALVTHVHADHLHADSLRTLAPRRLVIPRGAHRYLPRLDGEVYEIGAGESFSLDGFKIHAHAVRHPGWRHPFATPCPALGYTVTRDGFSVFHAGDTGDSPLFASLGETAPPDLAFLPIGAYSPRFVLKDKHLTPEEAVRAALAMRARLTVPVHFATFRLSFDALDAAFPRFVRAAREAGLNWATPWRT